MAWFHRRMTSSTFRVASFSWASVGLELANFIPWGRLRWYPGVIRGLVVTWGYETISLSQRPQRPRMATAGTIAATAQTGRPTDHLPPAGDRQRHPLRAAHWVLHGGCCPTTFHRGALSSTTSGPGVVPCGRVDSCTPSCGRPRVARPVPARPSSQSVGEDHGKRGPRGYDAGKKVKGRKRHIVVDTLGLPLAVAVHPADIQDRDGARLVLTRLLGRFPRLQLIWADGAYGGKLVEWARTVGGWTLELVRRPAQQHTFQVLPRRWVVERTFGWLNLQRRLRRTRSIV